MRKREGRSGEQAREMIALKTGGARESTNMELPLAPSLHRTSLWKAGIEMIPQTKRDSLEKRDFEENDQSLTSKLKDMQFATEKRTGTRRHGIRVLSLIHGSARLRTAAVSPLTEGVGGGMRLREMWFVLTRE